MQNTLSLVMLLCAILASLGLGVFAAYSICRLGFLVMHRHASRTADAPAPRLAQIWK